MLDTLIVVVLLVQQLKLCRTLQANVCAWKTGFASDYFFSNSTTNSWPEFHILLPHHDLPKFSSCIANLLSSSNQNALLGLQGQLKESKFTSTNIHKQLISISLSISLEWSQRACAGSLMVSRGSEDLLSAILCKSLASCKQI